MCSNLASHIDMDMLDQNRKNLEEGILKYSKEVSSGGKIIRAIYKQHYVKEVAFAGDMFFTAAGNQVYETVKGSEYFKYKVVYDNSENYKECVWCFN